MPLNEKQIERFCDAVFDLYESVDDSLRFPGERSPEATAEQDASAGRQRVDRSADYRGIACPMNYVKARLALETMRDGERLEILLDGGEPIENVPCSLSEDGQAIEKLKKENGYWRVLVRKQA